MTGRQARLLMCPPDHYGIEYEINPWMSRACESHHGKATIQWLQLRQIFEQLGATIELVDPVPGLPDMVFTANAGLVFHDRIVSSRFRHVERQGESAHFESWFTAHGFNVASLATPAPFEGAGDALFCGDILFAGYLHRSDIRAHTKLAHIVGCQVLGLELVDPRFYHLDTCFCPLAPGVALYFPEAFDDYGRRVLQAHIRTLIEVAEEDAVRFGCNAVVIGSDVVFNAGCDHLAEQLSVLGFRAHQADLSEFLKAGGAAKCLTLRLDGEEAAIWKSLAA
ncbi:N(G),N(G)-dimethylarginine dimethylaminohydrolase [Planctomycetes bacterium Pan216]|uniref:N(G),N(G)-dimethylarginine dimethylaminohydrolase n=1 Tax=Kolteria novifilia TaxID=2527975 RepID=A0A518AYL2_9BACT|nr:N(G),N(G)-dimethylarginine dimethylaminohydrolase [Planctomycetes bacterium Pan216]